METLINDIFTIKNDADFQSLALKIFDYQYKNIEIYQRYIQLLNIDATQINKIEDIPFLPISMFKFHKIATKEVNENQYFESSGTTSQTPSVHYIADLSIYERSFLSCFEQFIGQPSEFAILALLPSYLERKHSSLVYMVDKLMQKSQNPYNDFYLYNFNDLAQKLTYLRNNHIKTILFGVSFALLDFVEQFQIDFPELIVIETGGMKTRRKEMTRQEIHQILSTKFSVPNIYSEYGMAELLSQAYCTNGTTFSCPKWMKIILRDMQDPISKEPVPFGQKGGINIIDLANIYSCSFIATQDIGRLTDGNQFEVLGRFDNADLRGCNLLYEQ
ncbi:MAG: acyltransferase [Bacteroidales bacterium]|nr:acyltransferase [Bacteroidales bacterium]